MSRRPFFTASVAAMLAALIAGGTTLAAASPTAVVAKKHKATKCTGSTGNAGTAISGFGYIAAFKCNGMFSKFVLTTSKPVASGTGRGTATRTSGVATLSCQSGANTVTCSGVPANPSLVHVFYNSSGACNNPPSLTSKLTVNRKTFNLKASCT